MAQSDVSAHADRFAALGHDDRLAALDAIFRADEATVSFSTIRDAVGVRDPGRLAYHLRQLEPAFVKHDAAGYGLTRRGWNAAWVLRAGRFAEFPSSTEYPLDDACVRCGGSLVLGYDDQFGVVACRDCERWFVRYMLSPGGLDGRSDREVVDLLDHRARELRRAGNRGVCHVCAAPIERHLVADPQRYGHPVHVAYDCDRCRCTFTSTVGAAHVAHPDVVAFGQEHGLDVTDRPLWTLPFAFRVDCIEGRSAGDDGELQATVQIAGDGESLELTVGAGGRVTDVERR